MPSRFSPGRLKRARQAANLRPEAVAVAIGRSAQSIAGYEAGRVNPPIDVVGALADAVGVDPGDLFEVDGQVAR